MSMTVTLQITSGNDDCLKGDSNFSITHGNAPYWHHITYTFENGLRWTNVPIPQGAHIISAHLRWCAADTNAQAADPVVTIRGDAEDNCAPFSTLADFNARPRTIASVKYSVPAVTKDTWYETPDLAPIIQEIVSRPGWRMGNALALFTDPKPPTTTAIGGYSYDLNPSKACILEITYTVELGVSVTPESAVISVGETIMLTASPYGGAPPYIVDWFDNITGAHIGTGETYTFTATKVGTYEIYARVTDATGAIANSNIVTITVTSPPVGRTILLAEDALHVTAAINRPSLVRFGRYAYIAFYGSDYGIRVIKFNNETLAVEQDKRIADNPIGTDDHGAPAVIVDSKGYVHVFYGSHESTQYYAKSVNPEDVSAFNIKTLPITSPTYPQLALGYIGNIETIWLGYRRGTANAIVSTQDGGNSWSAEKGIVYFGPPYVIYASGLVSDRKKPTSTLHLCWQYYDSQAMVRENVYYAKSLDGGATWRRADGTIVSLPITKADADLVFDSTALPKLRYNAASYSVNPVEIRLDEYGNPYILFEVPSDESVRVARYEAGWKNTVVDSGLGTRFASCCFGIVRKSLTEVFTVDKDGKVRKYISRDGCKSFSFEGFIGNAFLNPTLLPYEGVSRMQSVLDLQPQSGFMPLCIWPLSALYLYGEFLTLTLGVIVSPESAALRVGDSQLFRAEPYGGTSPYTIEWIDVTTGNILGTGDTYTFTATTAGTFQIFARVIDSAGSRADSAIINITVSALPPEVVVLDNCDQIGDWKIYNSKESPYYIGDNRIEVDTVDKVEGAGCLKGTFGATGPNWGGQFIKPFPRLYDFSQKPLIRIWMKLHGAIPADADFWFELVTGGPPDYPWDIFWYSIREKLIIGEWVELAIDLRLPDRALGAPYPNLKQAVQLAITSWNATYEKPVAISWDYITIEPGPPIPPQATIRPESAFLLVGETATFKVSTIGGVKPLSFTWYVNDQLQAETSDTFTFKPTAKGTYTIKCVVTDAQSQTVTVTASAEVTEPPPPPQPVPPSPEVLRSEVRAVLIVQWGGEPNRDWNKVAEVCSDYGINTVFIETYLTHFWKNGQVVDLPELHTAISAFRSRGIRVHILNCLGLTPPDASMRALRGSDRHEVNWLCFTKKASRNMLKAVAESLARNYDIDGFCFDYIRWDFGGPDMCLCDECKAKFIADTGLSDVNWPTDVLSGGRYYWQFIEWRMKPIDEAVRDIGSWMRAIKPNIALSAAVFTAFENCGNYWPLQIGQHTAEWVDKGYLNFICPMLYSTDPTTNRNYLIDSLNFYTAGPEGKIPMIPFITDWNMDAAQPLAVENFVETVRQMKLNGADGWIIWAYFGPGMYPQNLDIRTYLTALFDAGLMEPVWVIQNLGVSLNPEKTQATISWTTTVPTTSRVEYSDEPMFVGTDRYGDFGRPFHYKDIDYIRGVIQEDITLKTTHSFTIPITAKTQFRIQCKDERGVTLTSPLMSVYEVPPPPPPPPPPIPPVGILALWGFPICSRFPNLPPCPIILNWAKRMGYIKEGA